MSEMWNYRGKTRPDFAAVPGPGQESVWDYPRPPALLPDRRLVEVFDGESLVARTLNSRRVCETASPPTFYIPPTDVNWDLLVSIDGSSYCEWKGAAEYWALRARTSAEPVAWSYPRPRPSFARLKGHVCFYPSRLECLVDGERVRPQPGRFYGGWITDDISGPFKGEPGTGHW